MPDIKNAADYREYEHSVAEFIEHEGIKHLSTSTEDYDSDGNGDGNVDPWFSWKPCQCCGSGLGGNREYLYGTDANGDRQQYTICEDCVYYIEYGRLDDSTMLRVEAAV